jgi:hypothetical protein
MRALLILLAVSLTGAGLRADDARDIVRKSVERDQQNWLRMKDYTWSAREIERRLDSNGKVKSEETKAWETMIVYGEPHRRIFERNGKPLAGDEQKKEQARLDKAVGKLESETPEQRQRRLAQREKNREKEREFLREVPDMFDFRLEPDEKIDGLDVWVITATPKPGYQPKHSDGKLLMKMKGKMWIDKAEYQWARLEAETTDTISFGLFLARLGRGAKLVFEQTRVNNEIWLPKREYVNASARLGLVKKLSMEQEVTWNNYRKFQVESKVISTQ